MKSSLSLYHCPDAVKGRFEISSLTVTLISLLADSVDGEDNGIKARSDQSVCLVYRPEEVAICARNDFDSLLFRVGDHLINCTG